MPSFKATESSEFVVRTGDLTPEDFRLLRDAEVVACDIETSGLDFNADAVGTIQINDGNGRAWLVQIEEREPAYIKTLMELPSVKKLFHYAPFDLGFLREKWGVRARNVACTKVAHRILFPHADSHSLQSILMEQLGVQIDKSKDVRISDWTTNNLSQAQIEYAIKDVEFLIPLLSHMMEIAEKRGLSRVVEQSFEYLPTRIETARLGAGDVFAY